MNFYKIKIYDKGADYLMYNQNILDDSMKIRRLRTINKIIEFIKDKDNGNSISRHFIETLILKHEVFFLKNGNRYLVDLDEVLEKLNLCVWKGV